jgi:BolA protein
MENSNSTAENTTAIEIEMRSRLENAMELTHFEVKDFTGRHLNHKLHEGGFHLEVIIVSPEFEGQNLVQRHRKVYEAMGELMKHEIHALSMKTHTPAEWERK